MKKILCALLCLSMLLSILVACSPEQGDGDGTTTGGEAENVKTFDLDLNGYTIIRYDYASNELITAISNFKKTVDAKCGISLGYTTDWIQNGKTEPEDAKEIVIGITKRKASQDTLESLDGSCFTVRIVGQRIVILGTDDQKTMQGIEYFLSSLLSTSSGSVIKCPEELCYISDTVPLLNVIENNKSEFKIVYKDGLDNSVSSTNEEDRRDLEVQWTLDLCDSVKKLAGSKNNILLPGTDWFNPNQGSDSSIPEILLGYVNRPELETVKSELALNEYTVQVVGNKIVVFGWNLTSLRLAIDKFESIMKSNLISNDDGTVSFSLASDFKFVGKTDEWMSDAPAYDGGKLDSCYDANKGYLVSLYTDTNENEFAAWRKKLTESGYTQLQENKIGDNIFATYISGNKSIHTYYTPHNNSVRVITNEDAPSHPNSAPQSYTKICETSITQMRLDYGAENFGMCYIFTLEDGSFIIYDGGGSKGQDTRRLYNTLKKLNKRTDGIRIAAWIVTHPHWDHRAVLEGFMSNYGSQVKLETLIFNSLDYYEMYNTSNYDESGDKSLPQIVSKYGAKILVPFTGQYFYIRNLKFEVIYSHESVFPEPMGVYNNSSMVTRVTVGSQKLTFLGDIQTEGCAIIENMYKGNDIKCDIVQVSHHGYQGASKKVYQLLSPTVLLWPTDQKSFEKQTSNSNASDYKGVDYFIANNLGVKEIFVADTTNKTLPLPYTVGSSKITEFE